MALCLVYAYRDGHPKGEAVPIREAIKLSAEALWTALWNRRSFSRRWAVDGCSASS